MAGAAARVVHPGTVGERGQAAVEAALVYPTTILLILGLLQLTLMQQARLMVEYAAFSAARVGAVQNMDRAQMRRAAILALLPTFPSSPGPGARSPMRVDDPTRLVARFAEVVRDNEAAAAFFGKRLIEVEPVNPVEEDFGAATEIDFDEVGDASAAARRPTQLTVRVTYFHELKIPAVNAVIFESQLALNAGMGLRGIDAWRPRLEGVAMPKDARFALESHALKANCRWSGITRETWIRLAAIARDTGRYFIPIVTTHTLRMQSNPFRKNALARSSTGC